MSTTAIGGTWWRNPGWPNPAWVYDNADHLCATPYKLGEMMAPNTPPIELRAPGSRSPTIHWNNSGLAGMGIIAVPTSSQLPDGGIGGGSYILGPGTTNPTNVPPNIVQSGSPVSMGPLMVANPVFYDNQGNVITSAVCGTIYNMTVPGYEGQYLHIVQTKNGATSFSGPMRMPMTNYASKCNQDEGSYTVQAFTQAGQMLGTTNFAVLAATGSPGGTGPLSPAGLPPLPAATGTPAPAPGTTSSTSNLPATSTTTPAMVATPGFFQTLSTTDWLVIAVLAVVVLNQSKGR